MDQPDDIISTAEALQDCIGKLTGPRDAKVIDHLDGHSQAWLAGAPLAFLAVDAESGVSLTLAGGTAGFARSDGAARLRIPLAACDRPDLWVPGRGFGSLFLVPGLGETLRVNGRVEAVDGQDVAVRVEECYIHCAKALIRSAFWQAAPADAGPADLRRLLERASLLALATSDGRGHVDVSPKGDPAGVLFRSADAAASGWRIPERPGNRRTDSFSNILVQPRVALAALRPGSACVAVVEATARLSRHAAGDADFVVDGKAPLLVVGLHELSAEVHTSPALQRAALWPARPYDGALDPAAMLVAHVRASRSRGMDEWRAKNVVPEPDVVRQSLDQDYRENLY